MSMYSEIDRLELAKQNIKLKLESKGITVPADARISDYAALINLLPEIKESEFTNRIVDNGNSGTGKAKIYTIKGKSLVWDQLIKNGNFANGAIGWGSSGGIISANDGILEWRVAGAVSVSSNLNQSVDFINNHKYYLSFFIKGSEENSINGGLGESSGGTGLLRISYGIEWKKIIAIVSPISASSYYLYLRPNLFAKSDFVAYFKNIIAIDLTLLFGTGNEPSTVEEFEAMFPEAYYPYNEGTLINNDAEAIESIGFNQWDEEWEVGSIDNTTGQNVTTSSTFRAKNYISVFPNTIYYVKSPNYSDNTRMRIFEYDANKNYLGINYNKTNEIITLSTNTKYIRFRLVSAGDTYNNDICINISNLAKNGTYEPYKKFTLPLNLNSFRVKDSEDNIITINGLRSAGDIYDEIVGNKYIKRIGEVDMGTLEWTYQSGKLIFIAFSPANSAPIVNNEGIPSICEKYTKTTAEVLLGGTASDKTMCINGGYWTGAQRIAIKDSNYTDAAAFKTAMSGVILYYELDTPIEYELVDEIDTIYDVDKNGVERIISPVHADGSPSAPFRASIGYPVNQEQ